MHFMVDEAYAAQLRKRWDHFELDTQAAGGGLSGPADHPGRAGAGRQGARRASGYQRDGAVATSNLRATAGRLLHDRTADKIARAVSLIPDAAATIVPYDVQSRIQEAYPDTLRAAGRARTRQGRSVGFPGRGAGRRSLRTPRPVAVGDHGGGPDPRPARHLRRTGQPSRGHHSRAGAPCVRSSSATTAARSA